MERRARDDRFSVDAVEGSGRSAFDGNHSNNLVSWLMWMKSPEKDVLNDDDIEILTGWMEQGHLAWMVVPING